MYSILQSNGSFIVFELMQSCELNKGDIISGEILGGGDSDLVNLTTKEKFTGYIQKINCNELGAKQGCFLIS